MREDYPPQASAAAFNLLDSHDTNRALFVFTESGDNGLTQARERLALAALVQFTYIGAPMVYYGDEAAINAPGLGVADPYNRAPYPWSDASGDPSTYGPADTSMIAYYSKLSKMRHELPALRTGSSRECSRTTLPGLRVRTRGRRGEAGDRRVEQEQLDSGRRATHRPFLLRRDSGRGSHRRHDDHGWRRRCPPISLAARAGAVLVGR